MSDNPYLADVQVGDKLYNFLEGNKEYVVAHICEEYEEIIVRPSSLPQGIEDSKSLEFSITIDGATELNQRVPYFLYAPVDVLDPKNLPPRPWKPKKGEWIWCRDAESSWDLRMFIKEDKHGYLVASALGNTYYAEIAPFKGELPPGLEEEDE